MTDAPRAIPDHLQQTWARATGEPDPLAALGASETCWRQWADWQAVLAAEALAAGATWEDIGRALGTSRQAAWARFRAAVAGTQGGERPMHEQLAQVRGEVRDRLQGVQARVRARDDTWRADRARLVAQLRTLDQQRAADREALRGEMRQLKQQLQTLRAQARPPAPDAPTG